MSREPAAALPPLPRLFVVAEVTLGHVFSPKPERAILKKFRNNIVHRSSSDHSRTQSIVAKQITGHKDGHESDDPGTACRSFIERLRLYESQSRRKQILITTVDQVLIALPVHTALCYIQYISGINNVTRAIKIPPSSYTRLSLFASSTKKREVSHINIKEYPKSGIAIISRKS